MQRLPPIVRMLCFAGASWRRQDRPGPRPGCCGFRTSTATGWRSPMAQHLDRPAGGGTATHITTHPGLELFPKFSPDGKWIAFTASTTATSRSTSCPPGRGAPAADLLPGLGP